jgi:alcohol dehydrogenase, propanol-preferring
MRAMVLEKSRAPLLMRERPTPAPAAGEILVEVAACGVCRTDLHVVDSELPNPKLPLIPGHEIVGRVAVLGEEVAGLAVGERIGVPWLGYTCGVCSYCRSGRENLCDRPLFTGYTRDGGYATHALADARYCFPLPERRDDAEIAPFLCAGLIGWRSYRMAGARGQGGYAEGASPDALGLYGFGAAAHILAQIAAWQGRRVYAFTRRDDTAAQVFAKSLGAVIPSFPYRLLWEERHVVSVANLTRADAREFLDIVPQAGVKTEVTRYPLAAANDALADLREGRLQGAAVLIP